jgi:TonB family protein
MRGRSVPYLLALLLLTPGLPLQAQPSKGSGQEAEAGQAPGAGPGSGSAAGSQTPPPSEPGGVKPVLEPPRLLEFVEAPYPEQAREQGLQAAVELEIVIDAEGRVSEARVVEPVGHGFDEAALEAVRRFVFKPATRDGESVPSRIRYRYLFEIREETVRTEPTPDQPAVSRLAGRLLNRDDEQPIAGAQVVLSSPERALSLSEQSDEQGRFVFDEQAPGRYSVTVFAEGFDSLDVREELLPGQVTEVLYRLESGGDQEAFSAVARVPPPPREVTRRVIEKQQLTRVAGTRGDPLRTVEVMPGVSRPRFGGGQLIVRGSSPQDTQPMFEGVPIDLLYHFGGLTSFVHPRLLDSIEFYPGNFSTRYGRGMGGIIEVRAADPTYDRVHGVADVNLFDASLLAEVPVLEEKAGITAAVRRSYVDLLLEAAGGAFEEDTFDMLAAPVYWDYQLVGSARLSERDKLRLMGYGSEDSFAMLFDQPAGSSEVTGQLDFGLQTHRFHATWERQLSDRLDQELDFAVGTLDLHFGFGEEIGFRLDGTQLMGRGEWRLRVSPRVRLIGGLDMLGGPGKVTYSGPALGQSEGGDARGSLSNQEMVEAAQKYAYYYPACYLESDLQLGRVQVVLGTRLDYYNLIRKWTFDPRLSSHYSLTDQVTLKGGMGLFSQPPDPFEVSTDLGNPELDPNRSLHLSTGVDYKPLEALTLGVEGYFKYLFQRVVGTEYGIEPYYINDGIGRVYGVELSAVLQPTGRLFGYLSYTLSRSERRDRDDAWRLFDYDQPHILNASLTYRLGRGWEVGGTFRLVSGNPMTPLEGGTLNLDTWDFWPRSGPPNSVRSSMFHRLDVRIEKLWTFTDWRLALYLDVQNAYNAANQEGLVYDYRYRQSTELNGLPILPVLGVRGEL